MKGLTRLRALLHVTPLLLILLGACGTMQPAPTEAPAQLNLPRAGSWSLEYGGDCLGREAERVDITQLDESAIVFDDFQLLRSEAGEYAGSALFFAAMPVDGRNIPYEVAYALKISDAGRLVGTQTVVEGGGHGLACPVELIFLGKR